MRALAAAAAVLLLTVAGCGPRYWYSQTLRTGSLAFGREASCSLDFRHASEMELSGHRKLGSICLVAENWIDRGFIPPDEFTDEVRSHLSADVCRMGGEVVTIGGACRLRGHDTVSYDVYAADHGHADERKRAQP